MFLSKTRRKPNQASTCDPIRGNNRDERDAFSTARGRNPGPVGLYRTNQPVSATKALQGKKWKPQTDRKVRGGGQTTKKPQGRLGLCAHRWVVFAIVAGCGHRTRAAMRGTHLKFKVMITVPLEGLLGGREHNVLEDAWGYCKAGSLLPPHPAHSAPRPQRSQVPTLSLWSAPALPWGSQQPPPHPRYTTVLSRLVHSWDAPHTGC